VLSREDFDALHRGEKPASFVELIDQDPAAYFAGEVEPIASW